MVMDKEIQKKIDELIESQKIFGLSPIGFQDLGSLKQAFEYSIERIDQILHNDNIETALGDLVHDWNVNEYNRNLVISRIMKNLESDLKSIKAKSENE